MSGNPAAVLGALATTPERRERGISRSVLVSRLLMGFIIALVAFYFAFAIRQLWVNWQTATWGDWTGLLPLFIAPLQLTTTLRRTSVCASVCAHCVMRFSLAMNALRRLRRRSQSRVQIRSCQMRHSKLAHCAPYAPHN